MPSSPVTTIVSAADASYFDFLLDLVTSLQAGPRSRRLPLSILDLGLEPEQRDRLSKQGARLVAPGWDFDFPHRERAPAYFKAMTARPHLPKYFPGYDIYLWIDADAWIQDDSVLDMLTRATSGGRLAIVPEIDRGYWTIHKRPKFWGQNQRAFAFAYGLPAGYRLGRNVILNSGVFALGAAAAHWRLWSAALGRALRRRRLAGARATASRNFHMMEQTALNYVVFADRAPATFLPAYCNWFCGKGTPMYEAGQRMLVEPHEPHRPLGIVHLAGKTMKERVWELATTDGGMVRTHLTFGGVRALQTHAAERAASPAIEASASDR